MLMSVRRGTPGEYLRLQVFGVLLLITPIVIINRILRHPEVQMSTILGAICAYMLIGMVFGFVYALVGRIDPPFFAQRGPTDQFDYFYFSYACLTTVGFGDFTARGDFGRSLSVLEAVLGQIFLVTLIARLVSLFKPPPRDTNSTTRSRHRQDCAYSPTGPGGSCSVGAGPSTGTSG